jgi:phage recombination protein Bet
MATRKPRTTQLTSAEPAPAARLAIRDTALTELGLDLNTWKVLTESIFPSAKTAEGILLAVRYCQARGLDVLKRPVHVVPMWSRALGREVETVWPGINEVQVTASRTGQYAGIDPAKFGPDVTRTFSGRAKTEGGWRDVQVEVTYPEWAEVTVYRLVNGIRCPFSEPIFWEETYSRAGGASSEVPTAMWIRRPRGQLLKCAKAASLRAAFPEESSYTAEEMAGKTIEPEEIALNGDGTPLQAETLAEASEPEPELPSVEIDAAFKTKVAKLIERAEQAQAWAQAEDYIASRFTGAQRAYALEALARAETTATTAEAA